MATRTKDRPQASSRSKTKHPASADGKARTEKAHPERRTTAKKATAKKSAAAGGTATGITAKNLTAEDRRFLTRNAHKLSKTTLRAKWIHDLDEHADRPGQSLATRSHEVIRHWAEERGGEPATVPGSRHNNRPGVLRFSFAERAGRRLETIGWDEWFETFDKRKLVFLYQEQLKNGNQSNFFRLDSPLREDA